MANPNAPYNSSFIPTCTRQVKPVVTPFDIPYFILVDVQDSSGQTWESILIAIMVFIERKCRI